MPIIFSKKAFFFSKLLIEKKDDPVACFMDFNKLSRLHKHKIFIKFFGISKISCYLCKM